MGVDVVNSDVANRFPEVICKIEGGYSEEAISQIIERLRRIRNERIQNEIAKKKEFFLMRREGGERGEILGGRIEYNSE